MIINENCFKGPSYKSQPKGLQCILILWEKHMTMWFKKQNKTKAKWNGRLSSETTNRLIMDVVKNNVAIDGREKNSYRVFATGHLWTTKIEVVEAEGLRTKTIVSSVEIPPSRTPVSSSLSGCHSLEIVPSFHHLASSPALPSERKYFHFLCRRQCLTWKASHSTAQKKSNLFLSKVQTQYLAKHVTYKEALRLNLHQNPKIKLISGNESMWRLPRNTNSLCTELGCENTSRVFEFWTEKVLFTVQPSLQNIFVLLPEKNNNKVCYTLKRPVVMWRSLETLETVVELSKRDLSWVFWFCGGGEKDGTKPRWWNLTLIGTLWKVLRSQPTVWLKLKSLLVYSQ